MVQETATPTEAPAETTAPAYEGTVTPETADATPTEEGATPAATDEAPAPVSIEDWLAAEEDLPPPPRDSWKEHLDGVRTKASEESWQQAVEYLKPQAEAAKQAAEASVALYKDANQAFSVLTGRLNKLVTDGLVDENTLTNVLQSNPRAWEALQAIGADAQKKAATEATQTASWNQHHATTQTVLEELFKTAGKPSLIKDFIPRLNQSFQGQAQYEAILKDALEAAKSAIWASGKGNGVQAEKERTKVEQRATQKPPQGAGTSGTRSERDELMDPTTSVQRLMEIRAAQKARGE